MSEWRDATPHDLEVIWPAVRSAHLMASEEQLREFAAEGPWRVRMSVKRDALLLRSWRAHLDVLSIRAAWGTPPRMRDVVSEARRLAREKGFASVISPLLAGAALEVYEAAGMTPDRTLVAFQGTPGYVAACNEARSGIATRRATAADLPSILAIDAGCFDEFWRYGDAELREAMRWERVVVAEAEGEIAGYASSQASGSSSTLGRLAVASRYRRRGVATSLMYDVADHAQRTGCLGLSLCTQVENEGSRALYERAGFAPVEQLYSLASISA